MPRTSGEGRGWHGDSKGHAEAGRKGGMAKKSNRKKNEASFSSR